MDEAKQNGDALKGRRYNGEGYDSATKKRLSETCPEPI